MAAGTKPLSWSVRGPAGRAARRARTERHRCAEWDAVNDTCPAGDFEIQTLKQEINVNAPEQVSVATNADAAFTFAIP